MALRNCLELGGPLKQHDCCSGPRVLQTPVSLCGLKVLVGLGGEGGGRENGKEKGIAGALHLGRL